MKSIGEASKAFSEKMIPWLQSMYDEIPELSEERKRELEEFCEKLLSFGWVLFDFVPITIYQEQFDSKEEADRYMMEYCSDENLNQIYQELLQSTLSTEDVENIKISYECQAYKACCSLIISIIEHYVVSEYKVTENSMLKPPAIEKIKNLNQEVNTNKIAIYYYLHNYSLYLGVKEVFKNIDDLKTVDDSNFSIPSRHCLQHGYSKRRYTKNDCLFLILLLFGLVSQKENILS